MSKPDCYKCTHRRDLPGDTHSSCSHPKAVDTFVQLHTGKYRNSTLKVVGNDHGVKKGWFLWPLNFDPIWLEECDGFENKN